MKIALGSDHGGFAIKEALRDVLVRRQIEVEDLGCHNLEAVDYPDYARAVAARVSTGAVDEGLLVCTTGIGMSMAANRYPRVRAALCLNPDMAETARTHNNANVLVLAGGKVNAEQAIAILNRWIGTSFSNAERHARRIAKMDPVSCGDSGTAAVQDIDPELFAAMQRETVRQQETIGLIASENYVSRAVREAQGSVLTNKYAEGYPGRRWYNGCQYVDEVEQLAIDRAKALFGAEHVNVQPHSGSSANIAVYLAVLKPGDTLMAMSLSHGGHLTHGHELNLSGRLYRIVSYGVQPGSEVLDYDEVERQAVAERPRLIVAGASAYPRLLDFERFRAIADRVGALLMVDMAHIAGLVAGGSHPSPFPHADLVTTTTHKTLRGPRSGMILCRERFAADIDRSIFPGTQGGPLMHTVAAKAVCYAEALRPGFKTYAHQVVRNARAMAATLKAHGCRIVSGGTDNHMLLVDVAPLNLTGKEAATELEKANIVVNKNVIPFDQKSPFVTSGIRIGTPGATTRGMGEAEVVRVAEMIASILRHRGDESVLARAREEIRTLARRFPAP
ncbi:MAG: ribose 5-phosphate isomerase B [Lentisphaerae bacterium]|nr:ribose 5-phosphate isomerase B [Lentisphaerota bacterium]